MSALQKYIHFCKNLHEYNIPKLKYKELNLRYKSLYKKIYKIDEGDVYKATFIIFILFFASIMIVSIIFTSLNVFIISLYSLLFSLLFSYRFSIALFKKIKTMENKINALLYLIKIDFSLIYMSLRSNSDYCLNFIKLIMDYNLPISNNFKEIFSKVHEGKNPELALLAIVTPSKDLDNYIKDLITCNFNQIPKLNDIDLSTAEKNFKIYLKEIKSKISIIFFIGLFFPISLCFLLLFQQMNISFTLLLIPIFLLSLNFLFKKFIVNDIFLLGLFNSHSNTGKRRFNEFLIFLKGFAINLKNNISPEKAFYLAYLENRHNLNLLRNIIRKQVSHIFSFTYSFSEMIDAFESEFKSVRYTILLNLIKKMVEESAYHSSDKIFEILNNLKKHQKLENKLDIIIKGEKFKVLLFLFLLPIVLGAIGGMLPFFTNITSLLNLNTDFLYDVYLNYNYITDFNTLEFILIFLIFLSSNIISAIYFLKIINFDAKFLLISISSVFYVLMFFITFTNFLLFI